MSSLSSRPLGGAGGAGVAPGSLTSRPLGGAGRAGVTPGSHLRLQSSLTSSRLLTTGMSSLLAKGGYMYQENLGYKYTIYP